MTVRFPTGPAGPVADCELSVPLVCEPEAVARPAGQTIPEAALPSCEPELQVEGYNTARVAANT